MITRMVIMGLLLSVLLFPVVGYVYAQPAYTTKTTLAAGIVDPRVEGKDGVGYVYFIENNNVLKRWHPLFGIQTVYVSAGYLAGVEVDFLGSRIYFLETISTNTYLRRCLWTGTSCILSTVYTLPSNYQIVDLEVQYLSIQGETVYISMYRPVAPYEARIIGVQYPSGNTFVVQSYTSLSPITISNLYVSLKFTVVSIFPPKILIEPVWTYVLDDVSTSTSSIVVKVGNNPPTIVESRPFNYAGLGQGRFTYLESLGNTIYYIYTERSPGTASFDGYLEMGRITNVLYGTPSTTPLYTSYFPYDIWRWFGNVDMFMDVYPSASTLGGYEVFASLIFRDGQGFQYRLIRLHGNPITLQVIEQYGPSTGFEYYSFAIEVTGDLIYGRITTDELVEALR